ncbi:MAG: F0F1 ATP synthase subunit epsilon [Ignavibacteriales bacterium]|nr:F0F1 ATP synthase subunit epsilon [Ignavibacteriales bacterium]
MADKTYHLDIVTPTRTVFSGEVTSFSAPGYVGGFQVLISHAPLLSSITVGEVKVVDAAGKTSKYATTGGFVEVNANKVTLLAETAERSDEIDVKRAEEARRRAMERLAKKEEVDEARARVALARALNRLKLAGKKSSTVQ